jgi:hypothetical protein
MNNENWNNGQQASGQTAIQHPQGQQLPPQTQGSFDPMTGQPIAPPYPQQGMPPHPQGQYPQGQHIPPHMHPPQPAKTGMSTGAKWGIGCGVAAFIGILIVCGLLAWLGSSMSSYQQADYHTIGGMQVDSVRSVVGERTVVYFNSSRSGGSSTLRIEYSDLSSADTQRYFDHLVSQGFTREADGVRKVSPDGSGTMIVEALTPDWSLYPNSIYIQYTFSR